MDTKELREKSKEEITEMLRAAREELREINFRVHRGEEKGVRRLRVLRNQIAQILTIQKEK